MEAKALPLPCASCGSGDRYIYGHGRVSSECRACLNKRNAKYQRSKGRAKHRRRAREWYRRTRGLTPDRYRKGG